MTLGARAVMIDKKKERGERVKGASQQAANNVVSMLHICDCNVICK